MARRAALLFVIALAALRAGDTAASGQPLTAAEVIERIRSHVGVPWTTPTVDTFKAGDPNTRVTGIATSFTDSYDVLERAAAAGLNLVISHEPSFYNHLDETKNLENDPVYRQKIDFIRKHNMVVFRFHDHWHRRNPDGIMVGMIRALGWEKYQNPSAPALFTVPETTVGGLAASIRDSLHDRTLRFVGDPAMKVSKVGMLPGAAGVEAQIPMLERDDVQVLVVGEAREWETVEYTRDAVAEGRAKGLIIIGHVLSEEAGMDECARWLKTFINEVPVRFMPAGEPFRSPGR